jgi:hypothetical protein
MRTASPDFWYGWWYATGSGSQLTWEVALVVPHKSDRPEFSQIDHEYEYRIR